MKMTKEDKEMLLNEYNLAGISDPEYYIKRTSGFIDFGDVVLPMDKPSIKKWFGFGEHNYEDRSAEADAASKSIEFFIRENMSQYTAKAFLDRLNGKCDCYRHPAVFFKAYLGQPDACRIGYVMFANVYGEFYQNGYESKPHRMMTQEEVERWRVFLTEEVEKFEKRLKTYLKRYGLSKCTYNTYWADR